MDDDDGRVAALLMRVLLDYAVFRGLAADALLAEAGLRVRDLAEEGGWVPVVWHRRLVAAVARGLDDPGWPVDMVGRERIDQLSVMGFVVMTSVDARDALARAIRYLRLLWSTASWELSEADRGRTLELVWSRRPPGGLGARLEDEIHVAAFVHHMRGCVDRPIPLTEVRFQHRRPKGAEAFEVFFGCPVRFGAATTGFSMAAEPLDRAVLTHGNERLNAFLRDQAELLLERVGNEDGLVPRTRELIARSLPTGEPTAGRIAHRLGMSERTLRRALATEGASFRGLVDDVRRRHAEALLVRRDHSLGEIALLLGFADPSAFSRAFRRWTGTSPSAHRGREPG